MFLGFAFILTLMLDFLYGSSKPNSDTLKPCKFCDISDEDNFDILWQVGMLIALEGRMLS
jgi:hypothetical protein